MPVECTLIGTPEYMHGQVLALRAMLLGIAELVRLAPTDLRVSSTGQLERLRESLPEATSPWTHTAIDDTEEWIRSATARPAR
jgi:hypothetical protein